MVKYLFLFFSFYSFSQEIQVLDFETKQPISYALVYFYSHTKHFDTKYTDENGVLSISNDKTYTSLIIECLGYVTATLIRKEVKEKLFLKTSLTKLEEVVVTNLKTTILGNNSSNIIENFPLLSVNQELSFYVENTLNKECFIKNFKFYCSKKTDKLKYVLRFRMYKKLDNSNYSNVLFEIPNNSFEISEKYDKQVYTLDLSDFALVLPKEGAFLSLELVAVKDKNGNIKEKLTYNNKDILFFHYSSDYPKSHSMINFLTYNKGVSMRNNIINSDKTEGNLMFVLEVFD